MTLRNAFANLATEAKQDDLNTMTAALVQATQAMQAAAEAINAKTVAVDTQALTLETTQKSMLEAMDHLTYLLGALLEKSPKLTADDQMMVQVSSSSAQWAGLCLNNVGSTLPGPSGTGYAYELTSMPWNLSHMGSVNVYNQLIFG